MSLILSGTSGLSDVDGSAAIQELKAEVDSLKAQLQGAA